MPLPPQRRLSPLSGCLPLLRQLRGIFISFSLRGPTGSSGQFSSSVRVRRSKCLSLGEIPAWPRNEGYVLPGGQYQLSRKKKKEKKGQFDSPHHLGRVYARRTHARRGVFFSPQELGVTSNAHAKYRKQPLGFLPLLSPECLLRDSRGGALSCSRLMRMSEVSSWPWPLCPSCRHACSFHLRGC